MLKLNDQLVCPTCKAETVIDYVGDVDGKELYFTKCQHQIGFCSRHKKAVRDVTDSSNLLAPFCDDCEGDNDRASYEVELLESGRLFI